MDSWNMLIAIVLCIYIRYMGCYIDIELQPSQWSDVINFASLYMPFSLRGLGF